MARVGTTNEAWDYTTAANVGGPGAADDGYDDEPAPQTSRSPSFIRVKSSEPYAAHESGDFIVADSRRHHDTASAPPLVTLEAPSVQRRWEEMNAALRVQILGVEGRAAELSPTAAARVRAVADAAEDLADVIGLAEGEPENAEILQHTYEWALNVVARVAAGGEPAPGELTVAEYSSLFVRKILDPMIEGALEVRGKRRSRAPREEDTIAKLREPIVWLNFSARAAG